MNYKLEKIIDNYLRGDNRKCHCGEVYVTRKDLRIHRQTCPRPMKAEES